MKIQINIFKAECGFQYVQELQFKKTDLLSTTSLQTIAGGYDQPYWNKLRQQCPQSHEMIFLLTDVFYHLLVCSLSSAAQLPILHSFRQLP